MDEVGAVQVCGVETHRRSTSYVTFCFSENVKLLQNNRTFTKTNKQTEAWHMKAVSWLCPREWQHQGPRTSLHPVKHSELEALPSQPPQLICFTEGDRLRQRE